MSIQIICTSQFKTTLPPKGIPQAFDWSFVPYSGEFDPKCAPPPPTQVRHLTFKPKHWSASQAKGFSLFWLCLVGYSHLQKQFDAWENFWIVGEGFDTFLSTSWYVWGMRIFKLPKYQEISLKFWQKSQMPGGVAWGGVCHGQF